MAAGRARCGARRALRWPSCRDLQGRHRLPAPAERHPRPARWRRVRGAASAGHPHGAERVADDLRAVLRRPFQLGAGTANIGASIGVATAPLDGEDYDTLLRAADPAMYRAKADRGTAATQPA